MDILVSELEKLNELDKIREGLNSYNLYMIRMSSLEKLFGKTAQLQVLENIFNNRGNTTFLFGITEETGLSHSSLSRVMEPLIKLGISKEQKVGKVFRTFMLNEENELTRKLLKFYKEMNKFLE